MAYMYNNIGDYLRNNEDFEQAKPYFEKALELALEVDNKRALTNAYSSLSSLFFYQNNFRQAIQYGQEALKVAQQLGFPDSEKHAASYLYRSYEVLGRTPTGSAIHENMAGCERFHPIERKPTTGGRYECQIRI